ncbi:transposase [Amphritea sp.]|uniref:transposase n=1 Tax=Amphritea sp. TaxID=1872502 RepID=UPI003D111F2F
MARFKHYDYNQTKMIPLRFADQIQPGTFEYTLSHVVDHDLDMSLFESRYRNDYNGAPAYDPAILLKIVLFAYSRGITSSRKIAQACRENVLFMTLSADSQPHHSTIAEFITQMDDVIAPLFTQLKGAKPFRFTQGMHSHAGAWERVKRSDPFNVPDDSLIAFSFPPR